MPKRPPLTLTPPPADLSWRQRFERRPKPRFKDDQSEQLDPIMGCPALQVPEDHEAKRIWRQLETFDTSRAEAEYSSLGRRGIHPRRLLALWVYAAMRKIQFASVLSRELKTDAALRFLSGGTWICAEVLKKFRREQGELIAAAVAWTVEVGVSEGFVDPEALATDSMRLQANASTKSMRTLTRSERRLKELKAIDPQSVPEPERRILEEKIAKHEAAVARCHEEGRTSHSITDPNAALMRLPNGASAPCHRITATAAGSTERFVVSVLVTWDPNDYGLLGPAVLDAREQLIAAGMPVVEGAPPMQVAADPGYLAREDLRFAAEVRDTIDILIRQPPPQVRRGAEGKALFGRDRFVILDDGKATCPAGLTMLGPYSRGDGSVEWKGTGCPECELRPQCTKGKRRSISLDAEGDRLRGLMKDRMEQPGASERYRQRIATVEPVFSYIEDVLGFRRAASRKKSTVLSQVLLNVLAHNLDRLHRCAARRAEADSKRPSSLLVVRVSGVSDSQGARLLAVWLPGWCLPSDLLVSAAPGGPWAHPAPLLLA